MILFFVDYIKSVTVYCIILNDIVSETNKSKIFDYIVTERQIPQMIPRIVFDLYKNAD